MLCFLYWALSKCNKDWITFLKKLDVIYNYKKKEREKIKQKCN
jgi:hypothetical protein